GPLPGRESGCSAACSAVRATVAPGARGARAAARAPGAARAPADRPRRRGKPQASAGAWSPGGPGFRAQLVAEGQDNPPSRPAAGGADAYTRPATCTPGLPASPRPALRTCHDTLEGPCRHDHQTG